MPTVGEREMQSVWIIEKWSEIDDDDDLEWKTSMKKRLRSIQEQ